MYLRELRMAMLLASRVGGMVVADLMDKCIISKYRARYIIREMTADKIIVRKGNKYHYNFSNGIARVTADIHAGMKTKAELDGRP